jgi:hypothetical protein
MLSNAATVSPNTEYQQFRLRRIQHGPDLIMGGDLGHSEQGLAIRALTTILELLLMIQKGRALHEEPRERGHPEVDHLADRVRAATLVGKPFQASSQRVQEGRQNAHPLPESNSFAPANPLCANRVKKSHPTQVASKPVVQPENFASPAEINIDSY